MSKRSLRQRVPDRLFALRDEYVTLAGEIASVTVETDSEPAKIDHVWIDVRAGEFGHLQMALSTSSRYNRAAGFDPRVRIGTIVSTWSELPPAGVWKATPLHYPALEAAQAIDYVAYERVALEELFVAKARRAIVAEAWGEFYVRAHIGVHQIHSRRASLGMPRDVVGQDGAVRFYYREPNVTEMLLCKFAGQP